MLTLTFKVADDAGLLLLDMKDVGESDLKKIDDEVKKIIGEAADFAQESPEPDPAELWTDVYVEA